MILQELGIEISENENDSNVDKRLIENILKNALVFMRWVNLFLVLGNKYENFLSYKIDNNDYKEAKSIYKISKRVAFKPFVAKTCSLIVVAEFCEINIKKVSIIRHQLVIAKASHVIMSLFFR